MPRRWERRQQHDRIARVGRQADLVVEVGSIIDNAGADDFDTDLDNARHHATDRALRFRPATRQESRRRFPG
jgi:hypothetical protein